MRVTKNVKEYIQREVAKKYAPAIKEVEDKKNRIADSLDIIEHQKLLQKELQKLTEGSPYNEYFEVKGQRKVLQIWNAKNGMKELSDELTALRDQEKEKAEDIVVMLELGGKMEDLEKALQDIEF